MKQLDAIKTISGALKTDPAVRAIFVKGSIARGVMDEYSDVDFYCLVHSGEMKDFLERRMGYLKLYRPVIYHSMADFVGPQVVAVYDDGLHFDFYTVTLETLKRTDAIKVIFDPENVMADYEQVPLNRSSDAIAEEFNAFSFCLLEFETAFSRGDRLWASRLSSHLSGHMAMIMRYISDPENAQLGYKRLHQKQDAALSTQLAEALNYATPDALPKGVQLLTLLAETLLEQLEDDVTNDINIAFFDFMKDRIERL